MRQTWLALFLTVGFTWQPAARAEVGDLTIQTDHPQYPGEGVFQTPEGCVRFATAGAKSDQDRALALYNWILTHQWHLMSPQEWNMPGIKPGERPDDTEMVVYDANKGRFSYGYGLCGTVHAWNEVYWQSLGLSARRRSFPGHTNSEVFLNGKWRTFDTDMAGIVSNRDQSVAGYDDIAKDLSLLDLKSAPWPKYPFAWPQDFEGMKSGWKEIAAGGHWYAMYAGGYAGQPAVVHLRQGETFTRYFDPDAFGGIAKRRFWHRQPGGPDRLWTFANGGTPFHDGAQSNCKGKTAYGNAVFEYSPDLTQDAYREGTVEATNVIADTDGLKSREGKPATVTFEHFSPYVICGDPVDDENPLTGRTTDGLIVEGAIRGSVQGEISNDQGQTWHDLAAPAKDFRWDLTEQVKGRYGWRVRFSWKGDAGISKVRFTTTCQMSQAIYPRLKPGGSTVTYRASHRAVVPILPNLTDEVATTSTFEQSELRSANLDFVGRRPGQRAAYTVRGPKPASVVFRIPTQTQLTGLSAAARFAVRSPSPAGAEYGLSWSTDGRDWHRFGHVPLPSDNEFSSGWVYGNVKAIPPGQKSVLVRVELNGGGYGTSLITAELYGLRETSTPGPVEITYGWDEAGQTREHTFQVPHSAETATTKIPTGKVIRDRFIRLKATAR